MDSDVPRLCGEAENLLVAPVLVEIGYVLALGARHRQLGDEEIGPELFLPQMAAADEFQRAGLDRDRVERHPGRANLMPLGMKIADVLMERCLLQSSRLLHQDAVLIKVQLAGPEQSRRDLD